MHVLNHAYAKEIKRPRLKHNKTKQNKTDCKIHKTNEEAVIVSQYGCPRRSKLKVNRANFLAFRPLTVEMVKRLVYESHLYFVRYVCRKLHSYFSYRKIPAIFHFLFYFYSAFGSHHTVLIRWVIARNTKQCSKQINIQEKNIFGANFLLSKPQNAIMLYVHFSDAIPE